MKTSTELLQMVNAYIAGIRYDRQPSSIYEPIKYVLSMGGKRIRPVLMMLSYNLYKDDPERILDQACALETYHNYTLLHDDLMDNADLRRGKPTVHRKWNANTAILSGDTMLVMAYQRMAQCPDEKLPGVLALFTETALEIGEGQQYDMDFEQRNDVREEEYIEMIRLKTSVLLACAMKMGALLADAPDADAANLYEFGQNIGLAFQLQDDLLDVYGDPAVFGKAIGGDIVSNKKTYMLINACLRANAAQRAELEMWLGAQEFDREEKVAAITSIYDQLGIRELCQRKIEEFYAKGKACLDRISVGKQRQQALLDFTDEMMRRKL